jgi:hypothetical protein
MVIHMYCAICHTRREECARIDETIQRNRESFDSIAKRLGVSRRVVARHRDHMDETKPEKPAQNLTPIILAPTYNFNVIVPAVREDLGAETGRLENDHPEHLEEAELGHA